MIHPGNAAADGYDMAVHGTAFILVKADIAVAQSNIGCLYRIRPRLIIAPVLVPSEAPYTTWLLLWSTAIFNLFV